MEVIKISDYSRSILLNKLAETLKCISELSDIYALELTDNRHLIKVKYTTKPDSNIYVGHPDDDFDLIREIFEYFDTYSEDVEIPTTS